MKRPTVAGLLIALFMLQACAAPSTPDTSEGTPAPPTTAATQSGTAARSAIHTASPDPGSESPTTVASSAKTTPAESSPSVITSVANKSLGLSNAFKSSGWTEGSYQPATTGTQQQAIATPVSCFSGSSSNQLEFRFASVPGTLKIQVAQDLNSDSSDAQLEWSLFADGRQVDTKLIGFKESQVLSADLSGVAAIKIQVKHKEQNCTGSATALITMLSIED